MTKKHRTLLLGEVVALDDAFRSQLQKKGRRMECYRAASLEAFEAFRDVVDHYSVDFVVVDSQYAQTQADKKFLLREEELWSYFEIAPLPLLVVSDEHMIERSNPAFQKMLGFAGQETGLGEYICDYVVAEDRDAFRSMLAQVLAGKLDYFQGEHRYRNSQDMVVWVNHIGFPMGHISQADRQVLLIAVDVTREKQAEQRSEQTLRINAIGQVAGGVAHDFNNVLAIVSASTHILRESLQDYGLEELVSYTDKMIQAIARGAGLTRQLMSFKLGDGVETHVVDLNVHLFGIDEMLRDALGDDIELDIEVASEPLCIEPGTGELDQIVMNLSLNARDAMPDGGTLRIVASDVTVGSKEEASRTGLQAGDWVLLEFTDTGIGMDAETAQRLFEPFYTTKARDGGTGIGLATVYRIVNRMGGRIYVESEPGQGTRFAIYIPVAERRAKDQEAERTGNGQKEKRLRAEGEGAACILLLEDEDDLRRPYRIFLERAGYRVLEAASVEQAQAIFDVHADEIDLLLADVVLPDGSGVELAERIWEVKPELNVVFISGYAPDLIYNESQDRHMHWGFLPKPVSRGELITSVDAYFVEAGGH